MNAFIR